MIQRLAIGYQPSAKRELRASVRRVLRLPDEGDETPADLLAVRLVPPKDPLLADKPADLQGCPDGDDDDGGDCVDVDQPAEKEEALECVERVADEAVGAVPDEPAVGGCDPETSPKRD